MSPGFPSFQVQQQRASLWGEGWYSGSWQLRYGPFNLKVKGLRLKASWTDLLPNALMCQRCCTHGHAGHCLESLSRSFITRPLQMENSILFYSCAATIFHCVHTCIICCTWFYNKEQFVSRDEVVFETKKSWCLVWPVKFLPGNSLVLVVRGNMIRVSVGPVCKNTTIMYTRHLNKIVGNFKMN